MALRWMNPNAVIYLREIKGQGKPYVEYALCEFGRAPAPLHPRLASALSRSLPRSPPTPRLWPRREGRQGTAAL